MTAADPPSRRQDDEPAVGETVAAPTNVDSADMPPVNLGPRRARKRRSVSTLERGRPVVAASAPLERGDGDLPHVRRPARPKPEGPLAERHDVVLDESRIDPDVQKVIKRLTRHGFEAYLVGGCVRDLLVDHRPKDFDVATSARPEDVRDLFRNSRIIGRRFRLVHVMFQGGNLIEVATFRQSPRDDGDPAELLIRSDNVFGEAHEDARRRDFTMNALFYDIEAKQILDWVGGLKDVESRQVHTIGDPETRFREDPVRILRALKFAGRLDFGIAPSVYDAIVYCRESLAQAARPRLAEEVLRLMRGGQARRTIYLAWETGVLDILLPELAALIHDASETDEDSAGQRVWRLLEHVDRCAHEQRPLDDVALWTLLLLEPMKEACLGARDRATAVADYLEPIIDRLAISRRHVDAMRRIVALLPKLATGKAGRFARTDVFPSAVEVAIADLTARGLPTANVERLRARSGSHPLPHASPEDPAVGRAGARDT